MTDHSPAELMSAAADNIRAFTHQTRPRRDYDVSRYWVQQLVHRYATEGAVAVAPRLRRPQGQNCKLGSLLVCKSVTPVVTDYRSNRASLALCHVFTSLPGPWSNTAVWKR